MLLKNLMEDKQLNFDRRLLSVRRFSSTVASGKDDKRKNDSPIPNLPPLPSYKSELKSGPVSNPVTVPFIWEHIPGRAKDEMKPKAHAVERPPIAPKLPPGRILKAKKEDSDKVFEDPGVSEFPVKVPYGSHCVPSSDEKVTKFERSEDTKGEESSDPGDSDEEYLDALDSLSRTESFFLNCSASGVSGLEGPDVKPHGTFSTDPETRDFMLGRFLPAAKALVSETPQYVPRKQPMVWEQPRQVKKVVGGDKRPPLQYVPNVVPYNAQENAEDSDDEFDEHGKLSAKVCGLLPRFICLKHSFCLLNPAPGMSVRTRVPMSPFSRTQVSSSSAGSFNETGETENEHAKGTTYKQRPVGGLQTTGLHEDKSVSKNDSNQITCQSNSQKLEGSTLYRRLQGSGKSPHHSELAQSSFYEQKGFLSIPREQKIAGVNKKGPYSFRELLADQSSDGEIVSGSSIAEKTLYVDIIHKVESPTVNSCSSDTKVQPNLRENDFKESPSTDSSFKDIENLTIALEETILSPNAQKAADFGLPSGMDIPKGFAQDEDLYLDSTASITLKVPDNVNLDFEVQRPPKPENLENSHGSYSEFPVPPPLPKSPSDSWLWRTLPSMPLRNPSLRSYLGTGSKNQVSKASSVDPKWETIVKTSKVQHQHTRFSEELLRPIPET